VTQLADTEEAPAVATRENAIVRRCTIATTLLPAAMLAVGGWLHRWTAEDAFINYRVVEQVMAGRGPVFNAGERVEAYTSPLWLGVLVVLRATIGQFAALTWTAVVFGLLIAVVGFAIGGRATRALHPGAVPVPLGLLAVAAVPVVWDFASSGLELSAVYLWLPSCWAAMIVLALADDPPQGKRRVAFLVLLGLGPVLRPDLGLMSIAFLCVWALLTRPRVMRLLSDVAIAFAIAIVYQVFRMGYFAALVPSTALAKDAGGIRFGDGVDYATDLLDSYVLWIPLVLIIGVVAYEMKRRPRRLAVATAGMFGAGLAHALYIVAIGGDYMHGRLLLPALLAVALPASIGIRPAARARPAHAAPVVAVAVVALWSVVCAGWFRYENPQALGLAEIQDMRQIAPRPLVDPDEDPQEWLIGAQVHDLYEDGARGTIPVFGQEVEATGDPDRLVWEIGAVGLAAYEAGIDVDIVDIGGLAEPLAARTDPIEGRPAGHRKEVDFEWYEARWGVPYAYGEPEKVAAATRALGCAPLRELTDATTKPMTPGRFVSNFFKSPRLTRLHVPRDPRAAAQKFCDE
jgi:arabinofuranosyltransferase